MKANQTVHKPAEQPRSSHNRDQRQTPQPGPEGTPWQFKALLVVIALSVVMIILKVFGVF